MERSERLAAIDSVAGDAYGWIEARIRALDASDLPEERKAMWRDRWLKHQQEIMQIGSRAYHAREG